MAYHRIPVTAAFPYFTNKTVQSDADRNMQRALWAIKDGKSVTVGGQRISSAEWFVSLFKPDSRDRPFLNNTRTLVPIPTSKVTPRPASRLTWTCFDIACRLAEQGYARDARAVILRETAVRSSKEARSAGEEAPSVAEHIASMGVDMQALRGVTAITLIDDVVSAGRNAMGAYMRLRAAGFEGDVALLAVSYTNYTPGLREPHYGRIIWQEGNVTSFRRSLADDEPTWTPPPVADWLPDPP